MKAFQIFKTGMHTSAGGQALSFSESDLEASVRAYDPAKHEAPIVVGHPKDNHPAYGWVGALSFADGAIVAEPKQVDPSFAEMVQRGSFKKRSASFYPPDHPSNPVPGAYYLRHVGFLGAQAPAVKGLKDVAFSDSDGCINFEEDWLVAGTLARLFRGLRDYMIAKDGLEKADQVLPNYSITDLESHAKDAMRAPAIPSYTEEPSMTPEQIAALQTENTTLKTANADLTTKVTKLTTDFSELQGQVASTQKAATLAGVKDQLQALVKVGKVLPKEVDQLSSFAATLDDGDKTFDFTEGDKTEKVSARALFLKQLEQRAVAVDFGERSGAEPKDGDPVASAQQKLRDQVNGK